MLYLYWTNSHHSKFVMSAYFSRDICQASILVIVVKRFIVIGPQQHVVYI